MSELTCLLCGGKGTVEEWKNGWFAHLDCQLRIAEEEYEADRWMEDSLYAEDVIGGLEV